MQIDDNDASNDYGTDDAILELFDFDGETYQKWIVTYLHNGYYKIISAQSSKAVSVKSGQENSNNVSLRQQSYTADYRQQWKITTTSSGQYKIKPRSSESYSTDWVMAAGSGIGTNGRNVEQREYINDTDYLDEWILRNICYSSQTLLEGQKKSKWCWAASSRMFSKHFTSLVNYTQNQAVNYIKGSEVNEGGDNSEIITAINYFISNTTLSSLNLISKNYEIFSESRLIDFLDDGYVVAIGRGWYTNINNSSSMNGAHETVIVGYTNNNGEIRFIVNDPWPVNEGKICLMSYEKIVNGRNAQTGESADTGVWIDCVVINTAYSNDTINYYFG